VVNKAALLWSALGGILTRYATAVDYSKPLKALVLWVAKKLFDPAHWNGCMPNRVIRIAAGYIRCALKQPRSKP